MIEIDLTNYRDLLFKSKTHLVIKNLLELLGSGFRHSEFNDVYYQVYEDIGVELVFSNEHYFKRLIVHNRCQEKRKIILPYELDFSLLMKEIESKLGVPERTGGGSQTMCYWVSYPELGIGITYKTNTTNDLQAKIEKIALTYPQSEEIRVQLLNRSEMTIYFQVRSRTYSPDLIGKLISLKPDRINEEDSNLFEVLITDNPHFSVRTQLRQLENFLRDNREQILNSTHDMELTVKFAIINHLPNSFKLQLPHEILLLMSELRLHTDFDFMT